MSKVSEQIHAIVTVSGKNLELFQEFHVNPPLAGVDDALPPYPSVRYKAFGATATLNDKDEWGCCVKINYSDVNLNVCKAVHRAWGVVVKPKTNVILKINQADFERLKALEAQHTRPYNEARDAEKQAREAEAAAMPQTLALQFGTYWGDYSTEEISSIVVVRPMTQRERAGVRATAEYLATLDRRFQVVGQRGHAGAGETRNTVTKRKAIGSLGAYELFPISEEEAAQLIADDRAAKDMEFRRKQQEQAAKAEAEQVRREKEETERRETEENELLVWDAGVIYAAAGNKMLHALMATFDEKAGRIEMYTTGYASEMLGAHTTFSIKEELKDKGFQFDGSKKAWFLPYSEEAGHTVVDLLKKYDTKVWPSALGYERCWECGTYSKHLDKNGYCGC